MAREYMCAFHSMRKETKRLSDAQFGQLMRALLEYSETGVEPTNLTALSDRVQSAFDIYAGQVDRDSEAYARKCARNRENIEKRWNKSNTTAYDGIRPNTNVYESYQEKEEEKGEEKEKEEYTPSKEGDKRKKKAKFVPPTLEEVTEYCRSRNSSVDPKTFYDFFTEGKWVDSKGKPVRNWKQKVITWEQYDAPTKEKTKDSSFDTDDFFEAASRRAYAGVGA